MIKRSPNHRESTVFSAGNHIATLKREGKTYRLVRDDDGLEWILTNRVHGEVRPFSFSVSKTENRPVSSIAETNDSGNEVFVVRDQMFEHDGKFYMLANHPEDKSWDQHLDSNVRYIGRLDGFPYATFSEIDYDHQRLREKLKTFRGVPVGVASGSGDEEHGHVVRLNDEFADVGLFIASISYLLYTSA